MVTYSVMPKINYLFTNGRLFLHCKYDNHLLKQNAQHNPAAAPTWRRQADFHILEYRSCILW
jgi:hypothetical protein